MHKKLLIAALAFFSVFVIASCGDSKETMVEETTEDINKIIKITQGEVVKEIGQDVAEETRANDNNEKDKNEKPYEAIDFEFPQKGMRPYAVMIDNEGTKSLPQGGLDKAQVIYEIIVEGGETRLMPVFWGKNPAMIGPVRSARHYFIDYAMEHDAIYIHFGWSPQAKRDIAKYKINNANGVQNGGEIFWDITKDRTNWQDSYTSMERILKYVDRAGYGKTTDKPLVFGYNERDVPLGDGKQAGNIQIKYSYYTCGYEYDEKTELYLRFRKGKPQIERVSGEQLKAKNIIIQYVKSHTIKGDAAGRQEVLNVGSGKGYYITGGKAIDITWSKQSRFSATEYRDSDGNFILLNPGQTWVQIVPVNGKVTIR